MASDDHAVASAREDLRRERGVALRDQPAVLALAHELGHGADRRQHDGGGRRRAPRSPRSGAALAVAREAEHAYCRVPHREPLGRLGAAEERRAREAEPMDHASSACRSGPSPRCAGSRRRSVARAQRGHGLQQEIEPFTGSRRATARRKPRARAVRASAPARSADGSATCRRRWEPRTLGRVRRPARSPGAQGVRDGDHGARPAERAADRLAALAPREDLEVRAAHRENVRDPEGLGEHRGAAPSG